MNYSELFNIAVECAKSELTRVLRMAEQNATGKVGTAITEKLFGEFFPASLFLAMYRHIEDYERRDFAEQVLLFESEPTQPDHAEPDADNDDF